MDYSRGADFYRWTLHAEDTKPEEFLAPWAMNYRLVGPMQREIARLNFEGKLQAVAEEQGKTTQILPFENWDAVVTYGASARVRQAVIRSRSAALWLLNSRTTSFSWPDTFAASTSGRPAPASSGSPRMW